MLKKMMLLLTVFGRGAGCGRRGASRWPERQSGNCFWPLGRGDLGKNKDFAGLVDIGGGRKMYMECRGKGAPRSFS